MKFVPSGISCGGPLDSKTGVILSPPNLPGWDHIEITRHFTETLGVPARLINDANASALAEWKYGAGVGTQNMIFLTFGTGLGAGLVLNGALFEGTNGMAGEIGHMRLAAFGPSGYGKCGSFEGFCSGAGIAELARGFARETLQRGEKVGVLCRTATCKKRSLRLKRLPRRRMTATQRHKRCFAFAARSWVRDWRCSSIYSIPK